MPRQSSGAESGTASKRSKREPKPKAAPGSLESFKTETIHRSKLVAAPYNPRILSDAAKRKLKRAIKKHGLLGPPIWNKRSGYIVGGHQRITLMDDLYGTDDYTLTVAVVDLDDAKEKEANLLLNNYEAQGDFDLEKLQGMLADDTIDLDGTGFEAADVYRLFGDSAATMARPSVLDELSEGVRYAHSQYEEVIKGSSKRDTADFYCVVVFKDTEDRDSFLDAYGLDQNRFQSGAELRRILLENVQPKPPEAEAEAKTDAEG